MRRIDREATRLTALTEDLLLLARLDEAPEGQLDRAPMDLRTLANDVELETAAGEGACFRLTLPLSDQP
ncbi:hypothetical protein ACFXGA_13090 [Actinosynnema sp. NPDC059335]|uniref:hypothetical protein n=1 Tax=Actinosynnema sp. NPDC059335 TaxID=3346804 RepID=UPI00366D11EB